MSLQGLGDIHHSRKVPFMMRVIYLANKTTVMIPHIQSALPFLHILWSSLQFIRSPKLHSFSSGSAPETGTLGVCRGAGDEPAQPWPRRNSYFLRDEYDLCLLQLRT